MKDVLKKYWIFLVPLIGLFLGNRIFNHFHAWLGIFVIVVSIVYLVYLIYKKSNN